MFFFVFVCENKQQEPYKSYSLSILANAICKIEIMIVIILFLKTKLKYNPFYEAWCDVACLFSKLILLKLN